MSTGHDEDRRNFLRIAVIGGFGVVAAATGSASVFLPPKVPAIEDGLKPLVPMAKLGAIGVKDPLTVELNLSVRDGWRLRNKVQRVYVVRIAAGGQASSFKALSPTCSHAGCSIEYATDENAFVCPCHGATFEADGALKKGPAPRDMDALDVDIADYLGKPWLWVRWQEFAMGTKERTPRGTA